jgi:hypothetical protein
MSCENTELVLLLLLCIETEHFLKKHTNSSQYSEQAVGWTTNKSNLDSQQGQNICVFSTCPDWLCGPPGLLFGCNGDYFALG